MKRPQQLGLALAMLTAAMNSHAQDLRTDPLRGITQCIDSSEFHAKSTDRLPARSTTRMVDTDAGPKPVSTADGYRMMLYRQSTQPLVNLKIERSASGKFDTDREAVMMELAHLAGNTKAPHQIAVETSTHDGIDVAALHNRIGTPGVVSLVELFDPASGTTATAYILNQAPASRDYADQAGYDALRERLVGLLAGCMARPAP